MPLGTIEYNDTEHEHVLNCPTEVPVGFTYVSELNRYYGTNHPETTREYSVQGLDTPMPGEYAVNNGENGAIVLADYAGVMHAMVPTNDVEKNKQRYDAAKTHLETLGYKQTNFFVPFS